MPWISPSSTLGPHSTQMVTDPLPVESPGGGRWRRKSPCWSTSASRSKPRNGDTQCQRQSRRWQSYCPCSWSPPTWLSSSHLLNHVAPFLGGARHTKSYLRAISFPSKLKIWLTILNPPSWTLIRSRVRKTKALRFFMGLEEEGDGSKWRQQYMGASLRLTKGVNRSSKSLGIGWVTDGSSCSTQLNWSTTLTARLSPPLIWLNLPVITKSGLIWPNWENAG